MKKLLFTILICPMLTHSWFLTKKESHSINFDSIKQEECQTTLKNTLEKIFPNAKPLQDSHPNLYKFAQEQQKKLGLSHIPILFFADDEASFIHTYTYNIQNDLIALKPAIIFDHDCLNDIERFKNFLTNQFLSIKMNWCKDDSSKSEINSILELIRNHLITEQYSHPQLLENTFPQSHEICKKIQQNLGLQDVPIQFLYANLPIGLWGQMVNVREKAKKPIKTGIFAIVLDRSLQQKSTSFFKIIVHHELTHVIQQLTQSEGVGYKKGIHNNNCGSVPLKILHENLKEQAADAASLDHCICFKCLQEYASFNKNFPSAMMNEEGYCVSPSGYLSKSEILEYADEMQRTYGQEGLCAAHRSM